MINYIDIIKGPVFTEKAVALTKAFSCYCVYVGIKASKPEIKAAIEGLFGVSVVKINTVSLPKKARVFRGRRGFVGAKKKAYFRLVNGQSLSMMNV